jgi:hypothetical protein
MIKLASSSLSLSLGDKSFSNIISQNKAVFYSGVKTR